MEKSGLFNLNFPGATIICDSLEKRNALVNYLKGESSSIDINLNLDDNDLFFSGSIYNTTYQHEGKHLHDHLLCPMLMHNYSLKLNALYFSYLLSQSWKKGNQPYKYIPLPFSAWMELPEDKKIDLIKKKGLEISDVPFFSLHQAVQVYRGQFQFSNVFDHYLALGALHFSEYNYNTTLNEPDSYNGDYSLRAVIESMAFIQQMTDIFYKYGSKGIDICLKIQEESFNNFMNIGNNRRNNYVDVNKRDYIGYAEYTSMYTFVKRYAFQTKINQKYWFPFTSYVLFWALSGNVLYDKKRACTPRSRLERLFTLYDVGIDLQLNDDDSIKELFDHPLETFNKWDTYITEAYAGTDFVLNQDSGVPYVTTTLSTPIDLSSFYQTIIQRNIQMTNHLKSIGHDKIAYYIQNINDAMQYMTTLYQIYPNYYLFPNNYSIKRNMFVNVPFRIIFKDIDPIKESECHIIRNGVSIVEDSIYGNSLSSSNIQPQILDWKYYYNIAKDIDFSDALFGESDIDMPADIIKEYLPGIKPWFFKFSILTS